MQTMPNVAVGATFRHVGVDPVTQTGVYVGLDGQPRRAEDGKHGQTCNTYPPTQSSKDGRQDPDTGQDAEQD